MKCLSLDLDGTTLKSGHEISKKTLEAIKQAQEAGVKVIINTGRTIETTLMVKEFDELNVPFITMNGSEVYNEKRERIHQVLLPHNLYFELSEKLEEMGLYVQTFTELGEFFNKTDVPKHIEEENHYIGQYQTKELFMKKNNISDLHSIKIFKILAMSFEEGEIKKAKEYLKNFDEINAVSSYEDNVEVNYKDASKGLAILKYAELTNTKFSEIYAIGDGGNDLAQFRVADKAIAMENAPDYIKAAADFVTKSNDEDGVVYAISNILKLI